MLISSTKNNEENQDRGKANEPPRFLEHLIRLFLFFMVLGPEDAFFLGLHLVEIFGDTELSCLQGQTSRSLCIHLQGVGSQ